MATWPRWTALSVDSLIQSIPTQFRSWVSTLFAGFLSPLNSFGQDTQFALSGQLTIDDNFMQVRYPASGSVEFTTSSTYTSGTFDVISFPWTFWSQKQPFFIMCNITAVNNSIIMGATMPSWTANPTTGNISINYIPGLANNTKYSVAFQVI